MTQTERLRDWLRASPWSSSMEIQRALNVTNATGRMSDLRVLGDREHFNVVKERDSHGIWRYAIEDRPVQLSLDVA